MSLTSLTREIMALKDWHEDRSRRGGPAPRRLRREIAERRQTYVAHPKAYRPSPEQIRAACLEIQAEWSEDERARRAR
jgi:hypothetical protein